MANDRDKHLKPLDHYDDTFQGKLSAARQNKKIFSHHSNVLVPGTVE